MNTRRRRLIPALLGFVIGTALAVAACTGTPTSPAGREILVLGGAGQLGAEIVKLLVRNGDRVSVLVRPQTDRSRLAGLTVHYLNGDALDVAAVSAALRAKRFRVVISALRVESGDIHFYEKAMTILAAQAKATGVSQIIHHGAVGAGANAAKFADLGWERVPGLLDRLRDQGSGEAILKRSGVPYTIIRNTRLYPDGTPATGKAELTTDDTVILPMTRADLALLTARCLGNVACFNKIYHVRDASLPWPPPGSPRN